MNCKTFSFDYFNLMSLSTSLESASQSDQDGQTVFALRHVVEAEEVKIDCLIHIRLDR